MHGPFWKRMLITVRGNVWSKEFFNFSRMMCYQFIAILKYFAQKAFTSRLEYVRAYILEYGPWPWL